MSKECAFSLSYRVQLKCCYRFLTNKGFSKAINVGPIVYKEAVEFDGICDFNKYCCIKWYEFNGMQFNYSSVVLVNSNENIPQFYKINQLFIEKDNETNVLFHCQMMKTIQYCEHFKSYEVDFLNTTKTLTIHELSSNEPTILHKLADGSLYVAPHSE